MNSKLQSHQLDAIYEKSSPKTRQNSGCVVIYTVIMLLTRYGPASILVYTGGMTLR